jgi:hypothetical protein
MTAEANSGGPLRGLLGRVTGHFCLNYCVGLMNCKTVENHGMFNTRAAPGVIQVDSVEFCIDCRTVLRFVYSHQPAHQIKDSEQTVGTHYTTGSREGGAKGLEPPHQVTSACEREWECSRGRACCWVMGHWHTPR